MEGDFYRKRRRRVDWQALGRRFLHNRRAVLAAIVAVPVLGFVMFGNRGVVQRIRLQRQKTELEARLRAAEAETRSLQAQIRALDGDLKAIEKVAREQHRMVREGETLYRVKKDR